MGHGENSHAHPTPCRGTSDLAGLATRPQDRTPGGRTSPHHPVGGARDVEPGNRRPVGHAAGAGVEVAHPLRSPTTGGTADQARPGKPRRYDVGTEKRILQKLGTRPPSGHATWTGQLLAAALGDISAQQVWRVLRRRGISLRRRRSWCHSTDPQFSRKAANIVGLYLDPPENAVVLAVDEKRHIQALERAQGWLRLPHGKALTGFSHGYKRHGTTTLVCSAGGRHRPRHGRSLSALPLARVLGLYESTCRPLRRL